MSSFGGAGSQRPMQRLVLCLDGTWNDRDDCTNVYHLANLVLEGPVPGERVVQRVFYQSGVGTGPLDKLTGGGFGFGLERNVREAYDWLVENYVKDDEIYVFGFSRGAFTARSLVGFLSACGLLARGAPLTVNQLWKGYVLLGRQREERVGWWEELFGHVTPPFRRLNELEYDQGKPMAGVVPNPTERLLMEYSNRRPIRYLGIFDTVGAVGWDALAIPGLRSKLAAQHNVHATKLIELCHHALAIDEHRSSFAHSALMEYRGSNERGWEKKHEDWRARIHQRWFVGSHSSVGGGYPDNVLAQRPLRWLIDGARAQGLVLEPLPPHGVPLDAGPDSFSSFAPPLWEHVLRAKRSYRLLDPPLEVRYSKRTGAAYSLRSIREELDSTVDAFAASKAEYAPPALVAYASDPLRKAAFPHLAQRVPAHRWLEDPPSSVDEASELSFPRPIRWLLKRDGHLLLAAWATVAASGIYVLADAFSLPARAEYFAALAAAWVGVDWAESRLGFALASDPRQPCKRALYEALFWVRAAGVVAFVTGAIAVIARLVTAGWDSDWSALAELAEESWWIPATTSLTVLLVAVLERAGSRRPSSTAPWLALGSVPLLAFLAVLPVLLGQAAAIAFRR